MLSLLSPSLLASGASSPSTWTIFGSFPASPHCLWSCWRLVVCKACLHLLPCSALRSRSASAGCAGSFPSPQSVRAQTDWWTKRGQLGTNYQLCCSGGEEIEQIKCRSTKAVFTSLYWSDHTENNDPSSARCLRSAQCSATQTAPVEQLKSASWSTPFSAGLHGLTGMNLVLAIFKVICWAIVS